MTAALFTYKVIEASFVFICHRSVKVTSGFPRSIFALVTRNSPDVPHRRSHSQAASAAHSAAQRAKRAAHLLFSRQRAAASRETLRRSLAELGARSRQQK